MFNNRARWAQALACTLFVVTFCAASPIASAQTKSDVAQIWSKMKKTNKSGGKELKLVFTQNGRQYTFQGYEKGIGLDNPPSLSVWVRPAGSKHRALLSTCSDESLDGTVDFGIWGPPSLPDKERKTFYSKHFDGNLFPKGEGTEFKNYWQQFYREAIIAAKKHLGIKK
jgi:hypothetical protein